MIQEKVIYTENGFHLKSDFTKNVIYTDNSSTRYFKKQLSDSLWVTKIKSKFWMISPSDMIIKLLPQSILFWLKPSMGMVICIFCPTQVALSDIKKTVNVSNTLIVLFVCLFGKPFLPHRMIHESFQYLVHMKKYLELRKEKELQLMGNGI